MLVAFNQYYQQYLASRGATDGVTAQSDGLSPSFRNLLEVLAVCVEDYHGFQAKLATYLRDEPTGGNAANNANYQVLYEDLRVQTNELLAKLANQTEVMKQYQSYAKLTSEDVENLQVQLGESVYAVCVCAASVCLTEV